MKSKSKKPKKTLTSARKAIVQEVNQILRDTFSDEDVESVDKNILVHTIVSPKVKTIRGNKHEAFFTTSAYDLVDKVVLAALRKTPKVADDSQLAFATMAGWMFVQEVYAHKKSDGSAAVTRTAKMSIAELRAKANELRAFGTGAIAHADELDRYADGREREDNPTIPTNPSRN